MTLEVYILYKTLGKDRYTKSVSASHHQLLFKTSHKHFYYTDLQVDGESSITTSFSGTGKVLGKVKLRFGEYTFYVGDIYYKPVGITTKTKKEIEKFVEDHSSQGTIYDLWSNSCQTYVKSVIQQFLKLDYPSSSDTVQEASNKDELTLELSSDSDVDENRSLDFLSVKREKSEDGGCFGTGGMDLQREKSGGGGCFGTGGMDFKRDKSGGGGFWKYPGFP